jgi:hypothetical protein
MYRLQLSVQLMNKTFFYGDPVSNIEDIRGQMELIEEEWSMWKIHRFPQLLETNPVQFLEYSEMQVVQDNGLVYVLNECGEFQILN